MEKLNLKSEPRVQIEWTDEKEKLAICRCWQSKKCLSVMVRIELTMKNTMIVLGRQLCAVKKRLTTARVKPILESIFLL